MTTPTLRNHAGLAMTTMDLPHAAPSPRKRPLPILTSSCRLVEAPRANVFIFLLPFPHDPIPPSLIANCHQSKPTTTTMKTTQPHPSVVVAHQIRFSRRVVDPDPTPEGTIRHAVPSCVTMTLQFTTSNARTRTRTNSSAASAMDTRATRVRC